MLEFTPESKETDIAGALKFLTNVMKKKAIVFVLSDFMADDYQHTLKITGNKHDVTGIRVYDEREEHIPNLGVVQMMDAESGALQLVNTQSRKGARRLREVLSGDGYGISAKVLPNRVAAP